MRGGRILWIFDQDGEGGFGDQHAAWPRVFLRREVHSAGGDSLQHSLHYYSFGGERGGAGDAGDGWPWCGCGGLAGFASEDFGGIGASGKELKVGSQELKASGDHKLLPQRRRGRTLRSRAAGSQDESRCGAIQRKACKPRAFSLGCTGL